MRRSETAEEAATFETKTIVFRSKRLGIRLRRVDDRDEEDCGFGCGARFERWIDDGNTPPPEGTEIASGSAVCRIAGKSTLGMSFEEISHTIREHVERPLSITFVRSSIAENASNILAGIPRRSFGAAVERAAEYVFCGSLATSLRLIDEESKRRVERKRSQRGGVGFISMVAETFRSENADERFDVIASENAHRKYRSRWLERVRSVYLTVEKEPDDEAASKTRTTATTEENVTSLVSLRPIALAEEAVAALVILTLADSSYDSVSRAAVRRLSRRMGVPGCVRVGAELEFATALRLRRVRRMRSPADSDMDDDERTDRRRGNLTRYLAIGGGALVGGLLIGLSGGLATPAVAAGVGAIASSGMIGTGAIAAHTFALSAFLATTGGAAVATTLFGTTGASLAAFKLSKRTRGISDFSFALCSRGDAVSLTICVSGWCCDEDDFFRSWGLVRTNNDDGGGDAEDKETLLLLDALRKGDISAREYQYICETNRRARMERNLARREAIEGKSSKDMLWWDETMPVGDVFTLLWERAEIVRLGNALRSTLRKEIVHSAVGETLKATALGAVMAAVVWPAVLVKTFDIVDNPWTVACSRADKAGVLLAETLSSGQYGRRPVRLIGFGLGARLIHRCLLELAAKNAHGIVEEAVLLGTPVVNDGDEWVRVRSVVSGRLVNGYMTNDWILSFLFRTLNWHVRGIAGISGTHTPPGLVENVDLTPIIGGHLEYRTKIKDILRYLRYPNRDFDR